MNATLATFDARWQALPAGTRTRLSLVATVLLALLLFAVAIRPAWQTLSSSSSRQGNLDAQLAQMQAQAAQASALKAKPVITLTQAVPLLEQQARAKLGPGTSFAVQGGEAVVGFKQASGQALADYLAHARVAAASTPTQARLTRNPEAQGKPPAWSGTLHLRLPSAS